MRLAALKLVVFAATFAAPARATEAPGLAAWLGEKGIDAEVAATQAGLLIVDRAAYDAKPQLGDGEGAQLATHLWHYVIGERTLGLAASMNGGASVLASKLPPSLDNLSKLFDDALVWQRSAKDCRLWIGREIPVEPADCAAGDGKSMAFALRRVLGYNAVVVAQKGRFLLVEGPSAAVAFGGQGLLFQDSAAKTLLTEDERRGGAMVQLVEGAGRFGVYETFLAQKAAVKNVAAGTKILLDDP